jgi:hypothetical protein
VKTKMIMESWRRFLKEETEGMKKIFVLVGPPSVGKSSWIRSTFGDTNPYIINRDVIAEKIAESYGWTYDDMFVDPSLIPPNEEKEIELEDGTKQKIPHHSKYGFVEPAPSYMKWPGAPKQVYSKVMKANGEVHSEHMTNFNAAKDSGLDIVVDMTNMSAGARKGALGAIEGREDEYKKIAVDFKYPSPEIVAAVAEKRNQEAKKQGKSKTIDLKLIKSMISRYEPPSVEEGFDEIVSIDNTELLKKIAEEP